MRTFVIAEAGSCFGGDLDTALRMITVAKSAGADAVKFQWTSNADALADRRVAWDYLDAYRVLEFPRPWLQTLATAAELSGIEFMCTVFIPEDIAVVAPYVKRFKIASFEVLDRAFVDAHAPFRKPIVMSLGRDGKWFVKPHNTSLLHCVAAYPAPIDEMNLSLLRPEPMLHGKDLYRRFDGLSDHSRHVMTGALAVAAGALIVEAHFRLDDTDPANADYGVSLSPVEFAAYIANIRLAERMLGDGIKRTMPSEERWARYAVKP